MLGLFPFAVSLRLLFQLLRRQPKLIGIVGRDPKLVIVHLLFRQGRVIQKIPPRLKPAVFHIFTLIGFKWGRMIIRPYNLYLNEFGVYTKLLTDPSGENSIKFRSSWSNIELILKSTKSFYRGKSRRSSSAETHVWNQSLNSSLKSKMTFFLACSYKT